MESINCMSQSSHGIKGKNNRDTTMNKTQSALLTGALAISSVFAMNAQTSANDDGKLLADASFNNTEISNKDALTPAIREGHFGQARTHSGQNNMMVVYISGAKGTDENPEKYTAKQYAEILQKAFANPKYTDNPADIVVFYRETEQDRVSTASVLINGEKYKTKSGRTTFTPMLIGKHIDTFADAYAKTKSVASYTSEMNKPSLVLNQN